ncbi:MAG: O-antigen ligase family protein [Verrucomicrobiota bacterium]
MYESDTQLIVVLIAVTYLAVLLWMEYKLMQERENSIAAVPAWRSPFLLKHAHFITFVMLCVVPYLACFDPTSTSTDLLVLLTAMAIGKGFAIWNRKVSLSGHTGEIRRIVLDALVPALAFVGSFQPNWEKWNQLYKYHDYLRWTGLFPNPNNFGVVMGVGVVLSVGLLVIRLQGKWCFLRQQTVKTSWRSWAMLSVVCPMVFLGLLKSFSRGAWLGTFLGLIYLGVSLRKLYNAMPVSCKKNVDALRSTFGLNQEAKPLLRKKSVKFAALFAALTLLALLAGFACISARHAEQLILKRTLSVANATDLSWRNRISAYVGALQMINDRPWAGFSWNQYELMYSEYYMDSRLTDGSVISSNSYFMLGIGVGLPALYTFAAYIWLSFAAIQLPRNPDFREKTSENRDSNDDMVGWLVQAETVVCRASAVVLLVGFWFDDGLFLLPLAVVFWTLLELIVPD